MLSLHSCCFGLCDHNLLTAVNNIELKQNITEAKTNKKTLVLKLYSSHTTESREANLSPKQEFIYLLQVSF